MVAKISTLSRLLTAMYYNENKVDKGKAVCIHAGGFLRNTNELSFPQKVQGFERLNQLNERAKTKTLHISLNFDPSEKLSDPKLRRIAEAYLQAIGFKGQPFLVYRHDDAGHPHIHIVVTTIREDGSRINTHNIGRNQSETARKEIEKKFGLVVARRKDTKQQSAITPINNTLQYGKTETREAINRIVTFAIKKNLFASIPELNVILRKYGVHADQGTENSRIYKHHGLNYRMLDPNGKPIGVPIKASSLSGKPTLKRLEELFEKNKPEKEKFKTALRTNIDSAIALQPKDLHELKNILAKSNIEMALRQAPDGKIYGVTFLDENNKLVCNGSDLGKPYSAAHLQKRLTDQITDSLSPKAQTHILLTTKQDDSEDLLQLLLRQENDFNQTPNQLTKKKRKKKRKYLGL